MKNVLFCNGEAWPHAMKEIILFLPLIQVKQLTVTDKSMNTLNAGHLKLLDQLHKIRPQM